MNLKVFFFTIIALKITCFLINRQGAKGDYFQGDRNLSVFTLAISLVGSVLGGGSILGSAEEAFKYGWAFLLYPLGFCIGFLLIGAGSGRRLRELGINTVAQIFEEVYQSTALKQIASFFSITSLFLILVAQIIASKKFLLAFGVESPFLFTAIWTLVFIYTVSGGFKAVVVSTVIQTTFFVVILLGSIIFVSSTHSELALGALQVRQDPPSERMLGWLLMPILFFIISQDVGQRCFAAKSHTVMVRATVLAGGIVCLAMAIPVFFGNMGALLGIAPEPNGSVLMSTLMHTTNPWITACIGGGLIAAITATAESLINAISSNFFHDFEFKRSPKAVSLMIAFSSLVLGVISNDIVPMVIMAYELSICTLFVPIFMAFFKRRGDPLSALLAIILGGLSLIYLKAVPKTPLCGYQLIALSLSTLGYAAGSLLHSRRALKVMVRS